MDTLFEDLTALLEADPEGLLDVLEGMEYEPEEEAEDASEFLPWV